MQDILLVRQNRNAETQSLYEVWNCPVISFIIRSRLGKEGKGIMSQTGREKKITLKDILFLQAIIMIYSISSVVAKTASAQEFLSFRFLLFYGLEIAILGVYAILWQQAIKKFELSIAYANRAMVMLWALVWAVVIFGERITLQNVIGLVLITVGTIVVNREEKADE